MASRILYNGLLYEAEGQYSDLEDELVDNKWTNIEDLLNRWKNEPLEEFIWSRPKEHYVLQYTRKGDYKAIVGTELVDIDNLISNPNVYYKELPIFADLDQRFSQEFWRFPQYLYHATDCNNIPSILKEGLNPYWGTGIYNRSSHGTFTSTESEGYIDSYGECKVAINMPQMKKNNDMPMVELEPEVFKRRVASAVYHYFGIEGEYEISSDAGEDENTYIISGAVPPKYISKVED